MNDAAANAMAEAMISAGTMTREQVDQGRAAEQVAAAGDTGASADAPAADVAPPAPTGPLTASGVLSPFADVQMPDGFDAPPSPTGYGLEPLRTEPLNVEQLRVVSETFHAGRIPVFLGRELYSEIAQINAQNLDLKGCDLMKAQSMAKLEAAWGDDTKKNIATACSFVESLDRVRPGILRVLRESGAGNSAVLVRQLYEHAQRIAAAPKK